MFFTEKKIILYNIHKVFQFYSFLKLDLDLFEYLVYL